MKKGYEGDELWTAVNPASGKRGIIDPEAELIPGETIVKLFYCKRLDGYGDSSRRVNLQSLGGRLHARKRRLNLPS